MPPLSSREKQIPTLKSSSQDVREWSRKVCLIEPTDGGMHSKVCLWFGLLSLPRLFSRWQSAAWQ
jgi:hypothetical protein